jgi:hypothetical protein
MLQPTRLQIAKSMASGSGKGDGRGGGDGGRGRKRGRPSRMDILRREAMAALGPAVAGGGAESSGSAVVPHAGIGEVALAAAPSAVEAGLIIPRPLFKSLMQPWALCGPHPLGDHVLHYAAWATASGQTLPVDLVALGRQVFDPTTTVWASTSLVARAAKGSLSRQAIQSAERRFYTAGDLVERHRHAGAQACDTTATE